LPDLICDTSPLQYLHQIGSLEILPVLAAQVLIPPAVVKELSEGIALGVDLPDVSAVNWITVRRPSAESALPLLTNLGAGEAQVLMLVLEHQDAVAVLDDALAREMAEALDLNFTGTLGLLLDAKKAGLIAEVRPLLDRLQALRFR